MYAPSLYGPPMMHPSPSFGHSPAASQYGGTPVVPGAASSYFQQGAAGQTESPRQSVYNMPQVQPGGGMASYPTGMSGYGTPGAMSMYGAPMYGQPGFGSTPSLYGMGAAGAHTSQYGFPQGAQSIYGGSQMGLAQQQQPQSGRQTPSLGAENMFGNVGLGEVGSTPRGTLPPDETIARDIRQRE